MKKTKRSLDPSRTTLIRRSFRADMMRRFAHIKSKIWNLFVVQDILGEKREIIFNIDPNTFQFVSDSDKIKMFRKWLKDEVDREILTVIGGASNKPWTSKYVQAAYRKGLLRSFTEMNKSKLSGDINWFGGASEQFLKSAFLQPTTTRQLELLFTRSFNALEGVTDEMSNKLSFILAEGFAKKKSAKTIAREMTSSIDSLSRVRALRIARTEIVRAQAEGQLDAFQMLGVNEVEAEVELTTAKDTLVCVECTDLEGKRYTVEEAHGVIPIHPNCFTKPSTPILTIEGWKRIDQIQVGDEVYTHRKRFRKVTNVILPVLDDVEIIYIAPKNKTKEEKRELAITSEHPVLGIDRWLRASELKEGSVVQFLMNNCRGCGVEIPFYKSFCCPRCITMSFKRPCFIPWQELIGKSESIEDTYYIAPTTIHLLRKRTILDREIQLYNLSVEEDESFIANGFVVHNCRCAWSPASNR